MFINIYNQSGKVPAILKVSVSAPASSSFRQIYSEEYCSPAKKIAILFISYQ